MKTIKKIIKRISNKRYKKNNDLLNKWTLEKMEEEDNNFEFLKAISAISIFIFTYIYYFVQIDNKKFTLLMIILSTVLYILFEILSQIDNDK